jgi:hypothetical protein
MRYLRDMSPSECIHRGIEDREIGRPQYELWALVKGLIESSCIL